MPERTDRELLELAARAAGIESPAGIRSDNTWWWYNGCMDGEGRKWNPLADDGDALRLAVDLKLLVDSGDSVTTVCNEIVDPIEQDHKQDRHAATRRAIVRAAAEIGANMQS